MASKKQTITRPMTLIKAQKTVSRQTPAPNKFSGKPAGLRQNSGRKR